MRARGTVLDDEVGLGDVERQELARRELVIEPVDRAVLQVRERIVARRPRRSCSENATCLSHAFD